MPALLDPLTDDLLLPLAHGFFTRKGGVPGGLELSGWTTLDAQNVRTTVALANHQYGLAVADNTFRFNDPRGSTRR